MSRFKHIPLRVELIEVLDQWIEKHRDYLLLFDGDNRSKAISYILCRVFLKEGMVTDTVFEAINEIDWDTL